MSGIDYFPDDRTYNPAEHRAVPARRPEDDALDRLASMSHYGGAEFDLRVVREALERQREERDRLASSGGAYMERALAAEAEVRQLREAQASLLAEQVRLTEGLREIAKDDDLVEANEGAFSIHAYRRCRDLARALLSANPPQGDAAEGSSPSDDDPPCPRCGMTAQVEASRSEPGRWMCHGCAQTFASPSDGGGAK